MGVWMVQNIYHILNIFLIWPAYISLCNFWYCKISFSPRYFAWYHKNPPVSVIKNHPIKEALFRAPKDYTFLLRLLVVSPSFLSFFFICLHPSRRAKVSTYLQAKEKSTGGYIWKKANREHKKKSVISLNQLIDVWFFHCKFR